MNKPKCKFQVGDKIVGVSCPEEWGGFNGVASTIKEELSPGYFRMVADQDIEGWNGRVFNLTGRLLEQHFEFDEIHSSPLYKALS